jgi:hypothetical protein
MRRKPTIQAPNGRQQEAMLRPMLAQGLNAVIARWLIEGPSERLLAAVTRAGALAPEEVEALRASTRQRLEAAVQQGAAVASLGESVLRTLLAGSPGRQVAPAGLVEELIRRWTAVAEESRPAWAATAPPPAPPPPPVQSAQTDPAPPAPEPAPPAASGEAGDRALAACDRGAGIEPGAAPAAKEGP